MFKASNESVSTSYPNPSFAFGGYSMSKFKALLAAVAVAFTAPASATVIAGGAIGYDPGAYYGGIGYAPTNFAEIGPAGRFRFLGSDVDTGAQFSAYTWCVDIFHSVDTGNYVITPLSVILSDPTKRQQLAALLSNSQAAIDSSIDPVATAAAFQLAIWEVVYETGTTGYNVASGDFYTYGTVDTNTYFVPLWGEANGFLSNVTGGIWTGNANRVSVLFSETLQSQAFLNPVPEPASWALMISGFGFVGGAVRRSRGRAVHA
jgi:hypothetical protein